MTSPSVKRIARDEYRRFDSAIASPCLDSRPCPSFDNHPDIPRAPDSAHLVYA